MNTYAKLSLGVLAAFTLGACEFQKQYECTITDPATGEVLKKVKVNYKSECAAIALGV